MFASDLVRALDTLGVEQRVVALRRGPGPATSFDAPARLLTTRDAPSMFDPRALRGLHAEIASFRPDIVQAHGGETLKHAVPATFGRAIPVVYRRIGSTPLWASSSAQRALYGALMRRAASVVAVADATRDETIEIFRVEPDRILTIPNAVDATRLCPRHPRDEVRKSIHVGPDVCMILSVGALTWEKDPLGMLAVADMVMRDLPRVVFAVAGDGPLRGDLECEVERRGLGGRVRLLGAREDVPDLLAASDVLLLASSTEGSPAVVIEAGLLGLPVAAYAIGGVPELVEHGLTGVLAPAGDRRALAAELAGLLVDPERRGMLGRRGSERCRMNFEIGAIAPRYLDVYERLASARTLSPRRPAT